MTQMMALDHIAALLRREVFMVIPQTLGADRLLADL